MRNLFQNPDGADTQARATLAYLEGREGLEASWDNQRLRYAAEPKILRWENCREQGYVIVLRANLRQLNIAFFEHRNSDDICAIEWEQITINAPTIDSAEFGGMYKNKFDVSQSFRYGEAIKMAEWIYGRLNDFWISAQ
jgi:hypothetical protein